MSESIYEEHRTRWVKLRNRLFRMVSVGVVNEPINMVYDVVSTAALLINLAVSILYTFDYFELTFGTLLKDIEAITVAFFAVDYVLRFITAQDLYPDMKLPKATFKYVTSFAGIIDLVSFLPYYLPFFFPSGVAAFRMFRVIRIFRLFRINAYYDSLNVIAEVFKSKKQQLMASVFIIGVMMIASSLAMYGLEHDAQPDVFSNAFSGIWWAVSTLLTVGYGDIYPITVAGKILSIFITFLGVGMVAIPTGIISAGFVEQYTRLKQVGDYAEEADIRFLKVQVQNGDTWSGIHIKDLGMPHNMIIAGIQRRENVIVPRGDVIIMPGDMLIFCAEPIKGDKPMEFKEIRLKHSHPWNGEAIKDIDISRQSFIVMVRRGGRTLIPKGNLILLEGDDVIMYTKKKVLPDFDLDIN